MQTKLRFASLQDPVIAAIVGEFYRFEARSDALTVLENIGAQCIQAKDREAPREDGSPMLRMWVRGLEVTADEKAKGYRGHFARMWMEFLPAGYYTLKAEKLDVPLTKHPQTDRAKGHHPNWGNPTMRAVETGKVFSGIAEAQALLDMLHVKYPAATIPGKQCLHVMLYNRNKEDGAPIDKVIVKIKPLQQGGAKLVLQKKKPKTEPLPNQKEAKQPEGKFTTMVQKKRSARKPPRDTAST